MYVYVQTYSKLAMWILLTFFFLFCIKVVFLGNEEGKFELTLSENPGSQVLGAEKIWNSLLISCKAKG